MSVNGASDPSTGMTLEQSASALKQYVGGGLYLTPVPADQTLPEDAEALEEAEAELLELHDDLFHEERWTRDSHGRFSGYLEGLGYGEQIKLKDGTRVKRDRNGTFRVVRQGAIRRGFGARDGARDALDRSARSANHEDAIGGKKRYRSFDDFVASAEQPDKLGKTWNEGDIVQVPSPSGYLMRGVVKGHTPEGRVVVQHGQLSHRTEFNPQDVRELPPSHDELLRRSGIAAREGRKLRAVPQAGDSPGVKAIRERMSRIDSPPLTRDYLEVGEMVRAEAALRQPRMRQRLTDLHDKREADLEALKDVPGLRSADRLAQRRQVWKEWRRASVLDEKGAAVAEVLGEIRPMGGVPRVGGSSALQETLDTVAPLLPADWIESANKRRGLRLRSGSGRAYYQDKGYSPDEAIIRSPENRPSTMLHELGHWVERHGVIEGPPTIMRIYDACRAWRDTRVRAGAPEMPELIPLTKLRPGHGYRRDENAWPDSFSDPYVGKRYSTGTTEVLTMGLEGVFFGAPRSEKDPEHLHFVAGVLAIL